MMKIINPRIHGILDYVTVILFLIMPALLGFTGFPAILCYILGGVHLLMTLLTAFPSGLFRVIPFPAHGLIEFFVSIALVLVPLLFATLFPGTSREFFIIIGFAIYIVWFLTDYNK